MRRVLIVEDVEAMRELLVELLDGIPGVEVSGKAGTGPEARLELDRRRPDLVLLDEVLPGESSLDLLGDILRRKIPVILVTGMSGVGRPLPLGAILRLRKPSWNTLEADRFRFAEALRKAWAEIPIAQRE